MDYAYDKLIDGYGGVVHFFESALKAIYYLAVDTRYANETERAKELRSQVGESFQRLDGAEAAFREFNYELLGSMSLRERDELGLVFAKRHTLRGRKKWVEWKYYFRVRPLPVPRLFRVSLSQQELERGQQLVDRVVTLARTSLISPMP